MRVIISYVPRGNQLARQWQLLQLIQHPAGIAVLWTALREALSHEVNVLVRKVEPTRMALAHVRGRMGLGTTRANKSAANVREVRQGLDDRELRRNVESRVK